MSFGNQLTDGDDTYSLNDVVDQLLSFVDFLLRICHDQTVEILLLVASVSGIGPALAFLDGAFSANGNLSLGFCFHFLQCVATRANEQTNFSEKT